MEWLQNPVIRTAVAGFVTAAAVDYAAFRSWKSYEDAYAYNWRVAFWRWGQGFIAGAMTGLGFEGIS